MMIQEIYSKYLECLSVSTDTRNIRVGSMFFALKGPNFNANSFASAALDAGAKYVVIDEPEEKEDNRFIVTSDVLTTLQQLALYHRRQLNIPIIAITGSNGKTTTKELVHAILKTQYKTSATIGNLNNHIGIPLTLLAISSDTEIGVVEMGANHQKEIESYCRITEPTHGLITNIGKAHLEGFGGIEGVKKGKGELFEYLSTHNGTAFINSEDAVIKSLPVSDRVYYYQKGDYYHCELLSDNPFVIIKAENEKDYTTHLIGKYNFLNIAAALCIGKYFKVEDEAANNAVANYNPENNRSQVISKGSNSIILDAYNANPSSMKVAIENFCTLKNDKKLLILGDMFELGNQSKEEHAELGSFIQNKNTEVILCGKEMSEAYKYCPKAHYFLNKASLENWLKAHPVFNTLILVKGSRGMGLESVLNFL